MFDTLDTSKLVSNRDHAKQAREKLLGMSEEIAASVAKMTAIIEDMDSELTKRIGEING